MIGILARAAIAVGIPERFSSIAAWGMAALMVGLAVWRLLAWDAGRIADAEKRGAESEAARIAVKATAIKNQADALNGKIATLFREKNDENARRTVARGTAVQLRGPGAIAACPTSPGLSSGSRGSEATLGRPDAAGAGMRPGEGMAIVPFEWLALSAQQCDLNLEESRSWRDWYARFSAQWEHLHSQSQATAGQP